MNTNERVGGVRGPSGAIPPGFELVPITTAEAAGTGTGIISILTGLVLLIPQTAEMLKDGILEPSEGSWIVGGILAVFGAIRFRKASGKLVVKK